MYDNREISWLKFNTRVLEEAERENVPPLERLRFLSIVTSNMDEFFMVRIGKVFESINSGEDKSELLPVIYKFSKEFYKKKKIVYNRVIEQLLENNIRISSVETFIDGRKNMLYKNFEKNIRPFLLAKVVMPDEPFPYLENKAVYCAVHLTSKGKNYLGLVMKSSELEKVMLTERKDSFEFVLTDDVIYEYAEFLFHGYKVNEKCLFRITRNADMEMLEREFSYIKDYRLKMKKLLRKRKSLSPVRIEISNQISKDFKNLIYNKCKPEIFSINKNPLSFDFVSDVLKFIPSELKKKLSYSDYLPFVPEWYTNNIDMFDKLKAEDVLLNYPYDSMKPFLRLLEQAAYDERVSSMKITLYRINTNSRVIQSLIKAAENGKDVFAVMELRARFDEENNINYSEILEKNGINVIYGPEKFKVHSKVCSIERTENGKTEYYTHIGTGNYNENTACLYTDLNLLTNDEIIGKDAAVFFHNLLTENLYFEYNELVVSPNGIENRIIEKLDELIGTENARAILKCNSLTSRRIMNKIEEVCEKGVKIDMIVRGVCCLIPSTPKMKENLKIISIVGRFLEHSRIYAFFKGDENEIYISSADLMTRNLRRRVEAAVPIKDKRLKIKITDYLEKMLCDDAKARVLNENAQYEKTENKNNFDSQMYFARINERKEEK